MVSSAQGYHINVRTSRPGICRAKTPASCTVSGGAIHDGDKAFATEQEAKNHIEKMEKQDNGGQSLRGRGKSVKVQRDEKAFEKACGILDDDERTVAMVKADGITLSKMSEIEPDSNFGGVGARKWMVTLRDADGNEIATIPYQKGAAIAHEEPTADEVMYTVVQEAYSVDQAGDDYDSWRDEYGYEEEEEMELDIDEKHPDYPEWTKAREEIQAEYDREMDAEIPDYDKQDNLSDMLYEHDFKAPRVLSKQRQAFEDSKKIRDNLVEKMGREKFDLYCYGNWGE